MPRKEDHELSRHSMYLFEGDYAELQTLFPDVGAAYVIRHLVRNTIKKVEKETKPQTDIITL